MHVFVQLHQISILCDLKARIESRMIWTQTQTQTGRQTDRHTHTQTHTHTHTHARAYVCTLAREINIPLTSLTLLAENFAKRVLNH